MICHHCKSRINKDLEFCALCGARVGRIFDKPWFWIGAVLLFVLMWRILAGGALTGLRKGFPSFF